MKHNILILFLAITTIVAAQNTEDINEPNTIENQFINLYKNSNNYQVYRVIKKADYLELQKNTLDSINKTKQETIAKQQQISLQNKQIDSLKHTITKIEKELSTALTKENSISLFGANLHKNIYNTILWSSIIGLLALLLFFIFKFKNSNVLTNEAKNTLAEIEKEFEQHRKKSLEREQKLRRKLQDEINKQRGV